MNCQQCRERLHDYLDETLEATERTQVGGHVTACTGCRRELEELRKTAVLVGSLEELPVPAGFLQGVRARIDRPTVWERLRGLLATPRPSVSVAIPVIIVAFVAVFYIMTRPPKTVEAPTGTPDTGKSAEPQIAYEREQRDLVLRAEDSRQPEGDAYQMRDRASELGEDEEAVASETTQAKTLDQAGDTANGPLAGERQDADGTTIASVHEKEGTSLGSPGAGVTGGAAGSDHTVRTEAKTAEGDKADTIEQKPEIGHAVVKDAGPRQDDATVQFAVLDLNTDLARLRRIALEHGGFITEQREEAQISALVISVPVKQFDKTVEQLQLENAKNIDALGKRRGMEQRQDGREMLLLIVRRVEEVLPGQ